MKNLHIRKIMWKSMLPTRDRSIPNALTHFKNIRVLPALVGGNLAVSDAIRSDKN